MSHFNTKEEPHSSRKILENTKKFLEKGWTQHRAAADSEGNSIDPISCEPDSFCLMGAFYKAWYPFFSDEVRNAQISLLMATVVNPVIYNDHLSRTKEEVLELVRRCIDSFPADPVSQESEKKTEEATKDESTRPSFKLPVVA